MVDKVRPLKIETATDGTEVDPFPIETNPAEDYLSSKGIALESLDTYLIDKTASSIQLTDPTSGARTLESLHTAVNEDFDNSSNGFVATNSQAAIEEAGDQAAAAIFPIQIIYNGNLSGDTFLSYSNLTPNSPMIVPVDADFKGFTFSNSRSTPDYTIEFRNNTDAGAAFYSVSKVNTQFFTDILTTPESFTSGNFISVKYVDDGGNANDVVITLFFQATP